MNECRYQIKIFSSIYEIHPDILDSMWRCQKKRGCLVTLLYIAACNRSNVNLYKSVDQFSISWHRHNTWTTNDYSIENQNQLFWLRTILSYCSLSIQWDPPPPHCVDKKYQTLYWAKCWLIKLDVNFWCLWFHFTFLPLLQLVKLFFHIWYVPIHVFSLLFYILHSHTRQTRANLNDI